MNKGELHHRWRYIRRFRPRYFVILFIISAVICLFALRSNYSHMVYLRNQVYAADKSGQGVVPAIQKLQQYVTSHMNTDLTGGNDNIHPPIQLKYTYDRAREASIESPDQNNFYTEAQNYCQAEYPVESSLFVWQSYVACVQNYLNSRNIKVGAPVSNVSPSIYEFDFASPSWSPDLAGWSLVATVLFFVLAVASKLTDWHYKRILK